MRRISLWFCMTFLLVIPHISSAQIDDGQTSVRVTSVAWSPDGTRIAASFEDSMVRVWEFNGETELGSPLLTFHPDLSDKAAWTPDGSYLVVQGTSGVREEVLRAQVTKWNVETGKQVDTLLDYSFNINMGENTYTYYSALPVFGFNSDYTMAAFSVNSNEITFSHRWEIIRVDNRKVHQILWSPDDSRIAIVFGDPDTYTIKTFDAASLELIDWISGDDYYVYDMQWNRASSQLAVSSIWANPFNPYVNVRTFSIFPDDVYSIAEDRLIRYLDANYAAIAWHPRENLLAIASPNEIQIFDPTVEEPIATISQEGVISLDWSPDSQFLAGGLRDGTIHIFPVP